MSDSNIQPPVVQPAENRFETMQGRRDTNGIHPPKSVDEEITGVLRTAQHNLQHSYEECEERIRRSPSVAVLSAFACGYLLRSLPFEAIVTAQVRLMLSLVRPALFVYGTAKVYEYLIGHATPGQTFSEGSSDTGKSGAIGHS